MIDLKPLAEPLAKFLLHLLTALGAWWQRRTNKASDPGQPFVEEFEETRTVIRRVRRVLRHPPRPAPPLLSRGERP